MRISTVVSVACSDEDWKVVPDYATGKVHVHAGEVYLCVDRAAANHLIGALEESLRLLDEAPIRF